MAEFLSFLEWLSGQKRVFAWLTYLLLLTSGFWVKVHPELFLGSVLAFLLALLLVLLEIQKKLTQVETRKPNLAETWPDIKQELGKALSRREAELSWLGGTLGDAWPQLRLILRPLAQSRRLPRITLNLAQVSPGFLKQITESGSHIPARAEAFWQEIQNFRQEFADYLAETGSTINLSRYDFMPNFHGLLINNSVLFLSHMRWEGKNLLIAEEPYERFDHRTDRGSYHIDLFRSWLDKAMNPPKG